MNYLIDLKPEYLNIDANILQKTLPSTAKVCFFGSRTSGCAKPYSDIDLLIDPGTPLSLDLLSTLTMAFDESLLPYKIDIADAATISNEFRKKIQSTLVPFEFAKINDFFFKSH